MLSRIQRLELSMWETMLVALVIGLGASLFVAVPVG
jgi:hypothetical protein